MYFKKPLLQSDKDNILYLAPIPVYQKVFDDEELHKYVYKYGYQNLTSDEKQMGQELVDQFDEKRAKQWDSFHHNDEWVEATEHNPIGSRYFVPPNNFLEDPNEKVQLIRKRIEDSFVEMVKSLEIPIISSPIITESWIQYYEPHAGRGHNQHNHCRWISSEEPQVGFSGGYYLSDGEPVKDHPYSGAFTFHLRGYSYFIRPKRGLLMMWPNDIIHSVKPFYGRVPRCVINFNIQL